jgi:N-acetylglucosamine-6-phosphate deacetylase
MRTVNEAIGDVSSMCVLVGARLFTGDAMLDDRLGQLLPGYRADLVLLDRNLSVIDTWVAGVGSSSA